MVMTDSTFELVGVPANGMKEIQAFSTHLHNFDTHVL